MQTRSPQTEAAPAFEPVQTPGQAETLAALAEEIYPECFEGMVPREQNLYMARLFLSPQAIEAQKREKGAAFFLVTFAGRPGGFLALVPEGGRLLLSKFYLHADYRGRGHAGAMMRFVEDFGRRHGCRAVWLTVNKGNARAIAVYKKAGFAVVRQQTADIGGGFVMDDYVLEKPL